MNIRQAWRDLRTPVDEYVDRCVIAAIEDHGLATGHDILTHAWSGRSLLAAWRCTPVTVYQSLRRLEDAGVIDQWGIGEQREYWLAV